MHAPAHHGGLRNPRAAARMIHLHFGAAGGFMGAMPPHGGLLAAPLAAAVVPHAPPPPPPDPEPEDLPSGGVIDIPCTAMRVDSLCGGTREAARGARGGAQGNEYDKYVIHQQPEPYSLVAPSEDVLMWAAKSGQELVVMNTRLQVITRHHQLRTSAQTVGIALSPKCVLFTNDCGFIIVISPMDKSFRLVEELELRIAINGQALRPTFGPVRVKLSRVLAGRSTYLLEDKDTIVHLLADPALALYFRISDIRQSVARRQTTIAPYDMKDLNNLPSQLLGRNDPLESAIMLLENRIILGGPILNSTHLEWAYFDVKKGVVRKERVFDGPPGSPSPKLHPHFLLKLRLNPLNLDEIYVHIMNPYATMDQPMERRLAKGELWVMGMSKQLNAFQWKRRERPPSFDDPNFKQMMQTPLDWTRTPGGILYVRWCDFEAIGPGDEYLADYRLCRSFTLTRVESTVSTLSSMAARVLQGFDRQSFPLQREEEVQVLQPPLVQPVQQPLMPLSERRRAATTGVTTPADFMRHVSAHFVDNTSHVYYEGEQVYDDTDELIERQRRAITQMNERTPFRSIFGTLFSQATLRENPVGKDGLPLDARKRKDRGDAMNIDEAEEDQPGPSNRRFFLPTRRRRAPPPPFDDGMMMDGRAEIDYDELMAAFAMEAAGGDEDMMQDEMMDILGVFGHRGVVAAAAAAPPPPGRADDLLQQLQQEEEDVEVVEVDDAAAAEEEQPGMLAADNEFPEL